MLTTSLYPCSNYLNCGIKMMRRLILFGTLLICCRAQSTYPLAYVLSTLTEPSGLPVIQYLVDNAEEPTECLNELHTYMSDLSVGKRYARKISTSFGEFPDESVEFTWNGFDYGVIEQCLDVNEDDEDGSPFSAHYCTALTAIEDLQVQVGTCWPSSCTKQDVETITTQISLLVVNETDPALYYVCLGPAPWEADAIAVLTIFSLIAAIIVVATVYDLYIRKHFVSSDSTSGETATTRGVKSKITDDNVNGEVTERYVPRDAENQYHVSEDLNGHAQDDTGDAIPPKGAHPDTVEDSPIDNMKMTSLTPSTETPVESVQEDGQQKNKKFVIFDSVMMSFSAATNLCFILSAKRPRSDLGVLHGLRVFSMFWIILLHCNLFLYGAQKFDNYYIVITTSSKFARMALNYGYFGVDTFFVMGGLLVTYTTLKKLTKSNGKMNWLMYYFHRYWRLTPALLGALALWMSLGIHLAGQGPYIEVFYGYVKLFCRSSWWTYPFYINNLVPFPGDNDTSCMGWAWYLACDMQFYLISPIIIISLYRNKKLGIGLILILTTLSLISMIGISWYYGINPIGQNFNDRLDRTLEVTYTKPYTRIHSYLVGMFVGYALFKTADRKIKMPWWLVTLGWLAAFALCMFCVYALNGARKNPSSFQLYQAVLWEGFSKFAWSVSMAWICFACIKGYGGIINTFLSWNFWIPMGRLTYCAYLIHPLVIYNVLLSGKSLFHFGILSFSYFYVGSVVFCYLAALILSLLMEIPATGLEKVMFTRK